MGRGGRNVNRRDAGAAGVRPTKRRDARGGERTRSSNQRCGMQGLARSTVFPRENDDFRRAG